MKKIIIFGCLGVLFLVGLISTTIFAVLYINSQNEIKVKNAELVACTVKANTDEVTTTACQETNTPAEYTFKDDGQGIKITYPTSWTGVLTTKVSTDFAYTPEYGKVISTYEYNLTKSGATLKFKEILAGIDGFGTGLKTSSFDYKVITGTNLVRYSAKGANDWKYVQKVDCSTFGEPMFDPAEVATYEVCVSSFFPGFGTNNASFATIKTSDATLLDEADQIAKSALN